MFGPAGKALDAAEEEVSKLTLQAAGGNRALYLLLTLQNVLFSVLIGVALWHTNHMYNYLDATDKMVAVVMQPDPTNFGEPYLKSLVRQTQTQALQTELSAVKTELTEVKVELSSLKNALADWNRKLDEYLTRRR